MKIAQGNDNLETWLARLAMAKTHGKPVELLQKTNKLEFSFASGVGISGWLVVCLFFFLESKVNIDEVVITY